MAHPHGCNYPGYVEVANAFNMSAAVSFQSNVRIVATSGQVADDHELPWGGHVEQFEKAMRNVEIAGGCVSICSYLQAAEGLAAAVVCQHQKTRFHCMGRICGGARVG
jgi:hypothetical protein